MTVSFVELNRRFAEYQADDTPENQAQRSYMRGLLGQEDGIVWDGLLQHRLVVVLGEPGSGKTAELKARHASAPSSCFFLELNRLVGEDVHTILDDDENRRFAKWKNGSAEATFFLDAVDESKLEREGDFFTALDRVEKAIGPAMRRARFVISSRISEWRPQVDQDGVLQRLGVDPEIRRSVEAGQQRPSSGRGLRNLQREPTRPDEKEQRPIVVVTLLPLMPSQIERYASAKGGVRNPQEFIDALEENNAWAFAGRPLDVEFLYSYWNEKGRLDSLTDLSEYMIGRLLAEVPDREKQDVLSPEKTREGAEFLAAVAIFCRRLKFRVSDASGTMGESLISTADVLPESWLPKERRAMMDRALFDAASYSAMSFHHRYHIDFLAAAWITRLMNGTCMVEELEDLLFARVNGQRVLRPSLKPVAAWLITEGQERWRSRLAEWILESCPEIHLSHGDPAALPLEYRRKILARLVEQYHGRNRVVLSWDRSALARFANQGLADEINRYLSDNSIAEDLRADLLMVVREGRLSACMPTVLAIFADPASSDELRSYAASVVRDIGDAEHRRQLAQLWLALPEISNNLLARLCEALFPQAIGAEGLLDLLGRSREVRDHSVDLPYYLDKLLKQALDAHKAKKLLCGVLKLVSTPPLMKEPPLSEHFHWMITLIPLCLQHLLSNRDLSDADMELVTSAIFVLEEAERLIDLYRLPSDSKDEPSIQQLVAHHAALRRKLFWERVAKYRHRNGKEPPLYGLAGYGALVELVSEDCEWLLADAGSDLPIANRRLALEIAADKLWSGRRSLMASLWKLLSQAKGNPELLGRCHRYAWSRIRAPFMGIWLRHVRHKLLGKWWWHRRFHHISELRQKVYDWWWLVWRLGDLRKGLYPSTLAHFAHLVGEDGSSQYGGSDWDKATEKWGKAISDAAKQGCMASWRLFSPPLPHKKQERNAVDHRVIAGLVGLQTLWREERLNFGELTADEVDLLVCYACNELNGLPEWFPSLLLARPLDAARTLERAIGGEWNYSAEMEHVHDVVAKLAWMSNPLNMLAQIVMSRLKEGDPLNQRMLEYALAVVIRACETVPEELLGVARTRVREYTLGQTQWFNWMNIWLQLDALPALDYLGSLLAEQAEGADDLVVRLCSVMHGRYDEQRQIENPSYLKPQALGRLIPLVHRYVREAEDIQRPSGRAYSPGARDHAQRFRSRLLEILGGSKEPEASGVLRNLLDEPSLAGHRDWILHLLDGRKYLLADDAAWEPKDVREFAKRYCSEPRSDYQLYRLAVRFLMDVKNQVEASENAADRLPLRSGDLEKDFRGILCDELTKRSLDWFKVVQEKEVDLGQKPDLSIERPGLNSLPIEIKLANLSHWTAPKLLERLENQLIGQYLRPANVRYGIYVMGNNEPKRRWEFAGDRIGFTELVTHIQKRAEELQRASGEKADGIEVIGIDFSDPRKR